MSFTAGATAILASLTTISASTLLPFIPPIVVLVPCVYGWSVTFAKMSDMGKYSFVHAGLVTLITTVGSVLPVIGMGGGFWSALVWVFVSELFTTLAIDPFLQPFAEGNGIVSAKQRTDHPNPLDNPDNIIRRNWPMRPKKPLS